MGQTYRAKIYPEREPEDCRWSILELLTLDTATVEIWILIAGPAIAVTAPTGPFGV